MNSNNNPYNNSRTNTQTNTNADTPELDSVVSSHTRNDDGGDTRSHSSDSSDIDISRSGSDREPILLPDDAPKPAVGMDGASGYVDMAGGRAVEAAADFQPTDDTTTVDELHNNGRVANDAANRLKTQQPYDTSSVGLVVFRADGRAPDEVFHSGFVKRDINSLIRVENSPFNSDVGVFGGVSTTSESGIAYDYALGIKGRYLYAVRLSDGGIGVPTRSRGESLHETVSHYIAPEDIIFSVGPLIDEESKGELRINPHSETDDVTASQAFNQVKEHVSAGELPFEERYQLRSELFFSESESLLAVGNPNDEVTLNDIKKILRHDGERNLSYDDVNQAVNNKLLKLNKNFQRNLSRSQSAEIASNRLVMGFQRMLKNLGSIFAKPIRMTGDLIAIDTVELQVRQPPRKTNDIELPNQGYIRSSHSDAYYQSGFKKIKINGNYSA